MPIKISIIVPVYNVERYLRRCLDSICGQTFSEIEIIIVNDGTKDNSQSIINEYSAKDGRIRSVIKENGGLSSARNAGLDIAIGEYVGFVDSDDWVEPQMFESMYKAAKESGADIVVCNYRRAYENWESDSFLNLLDENIDLDIIGLDGYYYQYFFSYIHGHEVWNKLFRHDIIKKNDLRFEQNQEIYSEDILFNLCFLCHIKKISSISRTFYNYYQRADSIMYTARPNLIIQYTELIERFLICVDKCGRLKQLENILPILFYNLLNVGLVDALRAGGDEATLQKALRSVSDSENYFSFMWRLAFGQALTIYCSKTNKGIKANLSGRFFAVCCLCKLDWVVAKWKYMRHKQQMLFTQTKRRPH